ncbi:6023_t:CDS:2, partial [Funneliformis geosporum]
TSNNTSQSGSVNEEEGWNNENTRLLINFLEENFSSYKKNKSNFAKMASNKQNGNDLKELTLYLELDGFSNNVELVNSFEEKQEPEENPIKIKNDQVNKKRKLTSQDSLAEAMISMRNMRQAVWEK